jgi:hypothetical protein
MSNHSSLCSVLCALCQPSRSLQMAACSIMHAVPAGCWLPILPFAVMIRGQRVQVVSAGTAYGLTVPSKKSREIAKLPHRAMTEFQYTSSI